MKESVPRTTHLERRLDQEARIYAQRLVKRATAARTKPDACAAAKITKRLEIERMLAESGSWRYDPNTHLALLFRLRALQKTGSGKGNAAGSRD